MNQHLNQALDALKQGEILKNSSNPTLYFALAQDKVWVRNDHIRLHLSLEDFMSLYAQESFKPHKRAKDEGIDLEKDVEYYQWWK